MSEEGEHGDAFEIVDFTVASPWERFIARIEEILRGWMHSSANPASPATNKDRKGGQEENDKEDELWNEVSQEETLSYAGWSYNLIYAKAPKREFNDPKYGHLPHKFQIFMDSSLDFPVEGHDIQRWFGVDEFIIMQPLANSATEMSEASQLLSSLSIAADNTQCHIPLFVPIGEGYEGRYMGYILDSGYCARFMCENFNPTGNKSGRFGNMENLVEYFHKQLIKNCNNSAQTRDLTPFTTVAAKFTYLREDWYDEWRGIHSCNSCDEERQRMVQESPQENMRLKTDFRTNSDIYWGPLSDPLEALHLAAIWDPSTMPKNRFWVDNSIRSDFRPKHAPVWNLRATFRDFEKACPLTLSIRVLLTAYVESLEAPSLHLFAKEEESPAEQKQGLVQVVETLTRTITSLNAPVVPTTQELEVIIRDLFSKSANEAVVPKMPLHQVKTINIKGAPPFSIASDLACRMLDMQCLPAIALLWIEFVKEVRWCWEHCVPVPNAPFEHIDISASLIYQKLQMLNYCINRKIKERKRKKPKKKKPTEESTVDTTDQEPTEQPLIPEPKADRTAPKSKLDSWDDEPAAPAKPVRRRGSDDDFFSILNDKAAPKTQTATTTTTTTTTPAPAAPIPKSAVKLEEKPEIIDVDAIEDSPDGWDNAMELEGLSSEESDLADDEEYQDAQDDKKILSLDGWDDLPDLDLSTQYLLYREKPIVAPETQESGLMTEDMLKEQMEVFKSLGTSEEAALIRAKLQTPSLKSDMESFKAENEGCVLEDFIRWYSPRDWIVKDNASEFDAKLITQADSENGGEVRGKGMGREGHLSARMRVPGNLWRLLWKEAEAVPAHKQPLLFKHVTEAEKVLHYLENLQLPDILHQLISILFNVILYTFKPTPQKASNEPDDKDNENTPPVLPHTHTTPPLGVDLAPFVDSFDNFLEALGMYWQESHLPEIEVEVKNLTNLWQAFQALECMAAKSTTLLQKMPGKLNIVTHLLMGNEVTIPDHVRPDFIEFFSETNGDFPRPDTREYVIRCAAPEVNPVPNRLYACLTAREAKVATVFSLDE